jgi:hypothetical protein
MSEDCHEVCNMMELENYSQKPEDEGSRYKHYTELLELWEDGLELLYRQSNFGHSHALAMKILQLECAILTLKIQIDVLCGYKKTDYALRYKIDNSFSNISGGRGTPLKRDDESHWYKKDDDDLLGV